MIQLFDLHADIGCALQEAYDSGERGMLASWMQRMEKGGIKYSAAASFFRGNESWEDMQHVVSLVKDEIENAKANVILDKKNLNIKSERVTFIQTIEGMCGIHGDVKNKIDWLYAMGNRIGSLCWNDQNDLATGNAGSPSRGLTKLGVDAIREMNKKKFIVDVSHANEKTFWDIMSVSTMPIVATHSNAKGLCFVERNLSDQQIRAIGEKGGLIGLNACASFISKDENNKNARQLARHARYIADLAGIQTVCVGFDLGAYYFNQDHHDIHEPEDGQNFIKALEDEGFQTSEIRKIAYENVFTFLKANL